MSTDNRLFKPSTEEIERRYRNTRAAMEKAGLDALIISGSEYTGFEGALRYMCGFHILHRYAYVVIPMDGTPTAVFPREATWVGDHAATFIDEQVKGAPLVKKFGLEAIPTGYMLIESGPLTSVQYISGSMPIPRGKHDIACAHALAAQYLGMKLVYLEAGSGAQNPVPLEMIRAVRSCVDIPVAVGGGLKSPEDCAARIEAGASFVVMGNYLESDSNFGLLKELTAATHCKDSIKI